MNPASLFKYGNKRLQVFFIDDDGYPIGIEADGTIPDPNDADPGTAYHALVLPGYISATPPVRELVTATDQADGTNYGDIDMGISSYGIVDITLSQRYEPFFQMASGVTPNTSISSALRISSSNNTSLTQRKMGLIVTDRVRDEATNTTLYEHTVYNVGTFSVTQRAEGNQSGGVNPSPLKVAFKPLPSERLSFLGMLYSALDLNVDEDVDTDSPITSPYEFTLTTFIKDGVATTFSTKYKGLVAGATIGGVNVYTSQGVQAALTSYNQTTKLATMSAVGTADHRAVLAYATGFKE
jgi:hypothetical protein